MWISRYSRHKGNIEMIMYMKQKIQAINTQIKMILKRFFYMVKSQIKWTKTNPFLLRIFQNTDPFMVFRKSITTGHFWWKTFWSMSLYSLVTPSRINFGITVPNSKNSKFLSHPISCQFCYKNMSIHFICLILVCLQI